MSMPSFAGQSLLPFMARLVLGAAFFFSGWHLCFGTVSLSPDQIDVLEGKTAAVSVALVQVEDKPAAPAAGPEDRPAAMHVALLLDGVGLGDWAIASAWAVSVIELIGGALLVIGLLTRATSLVLAVLLGLAFWVSSVHTAGMFELDPLAWASDSRTFYEMFFLLMGFVLAVGILMTGPGLCALDHIIWPGRGSAPDTGLAEAQQAG